MEYWTNINIVKSSCFQSKKIIELQWGISSLETKVSLEHNLWSIIVRKYKLIAREKVICYEGHKSKTLKSRSKSVNDPSYKRKIMTKKKLKLPNWAWISSVNGCHSSPLRKSNPITFLDFNKPIILNPVHENRFFRLCEASSYRKN